MASNYPMNEDGDSRSRSHSREGPRPHRGMHEEDEAELDDEEREVKVPMMPRGGGQAVDDDDVTGEVGHRNAAGTLGQPVYDELEPNATSGELKYQTYGPPNMESDTRPVMADTPKPTGLLAWIGFGLSVFSLAAVCISFASPYWLQQWPNSFNTFQNLGLWEVCFHNYMHHRDDSQEIYNGCWWVFNGDKKYWKLREWLLPPWFIACQVMMTMVLLILIGTVLVVGLVFLHVCPMNNHEFHQIFSMFISSALLFLVTMTEFIVAVVFGTQSGDRRWMPRPDWNFLSWGFGFLIISGMVALAGGLALFVAASRAYDKLTKQQEEFFKQTLDLAEMATMSQSAYQPSYGYSSQPSYERDSMPSQGGYSEKGGGGYPNEKGGGGYPGEKGGGSGYVDKPSYASQPSYGSQQGYSGAGPGGYNKDPGGYDKDPGGYDKDPGGYDKDPSGYDRQANYDRHPSYGSQGGAYQQDYAPPSYNGILQSDA